VQNRVHSWVQNREHKTVLNRVQNRVQNRVPNRVPNRVHNSTADSTAQWAGGYCKGEQEMQVRSQGGSRTEEAVAERILPWTTGTRYGAACSQPQRSKTWGTWGTR